MKKYRGLVSLLLTVFYSSSTASSVTLFPENQPQNHLIRSAFTNYLFLGQLNGKGSSRANLGFDHKLIGLDIFQSQSIALGLNAMTHIYMFPEDRKFFVDNFYASFSFFFEYAQNARLLWRFSPFYHLSAHLADGYMKTKGGTDAVFTGNIKDDKKTVSNEMVYLSLLYKPHRLPCFSCTAGFGAYYHTIERKNLQAIADILIQGKFPVSDGINPLMRMKYEVVFEHTAHNNIVFSAGIQVMSRYGGSIMILFTCFNMINPGQYYLYREKGAGAEVRFLY